MSNADLGIGPRVRTLRVERGLSLQDVAARCDRTKAWLWDIEQGRQTNPTVNSALALSRALGVSLNHLLGLSDKTPDLHPEAMRIAVEIDALLRFGK